MMGPCWSRTTIFPMSSNENSKDKEKLVSDADKPRQIEENPGQFVEKQLAEPFEHDKTSILNVEPEDEHTLIEKRISDDSISTNSSESGGTAAWNFNPLLCRHSSSNMFSSTPKIVSPEDCHHSKIFNYDRLPSPALSPIENIKLTNRGQIDRISNEPKTILEFRQLKSDRKKFNTKKRKTLRRPNKEMQRILEGRLIGSENRRNARHRRHVVIVRDVESDSDAV